MSELPLQATIVRHNAPPVSTVVGAKTYVLPPTIILPAPEEAKSGAVEVNFPGTIPRTMIAGEAPVIDSEKTVVKAIIVDKPTILGNPTVIDRAATVVKGRGGTLSPLEQAPQFSEAELDDLIHHRTQALLKHLKPRYFVLEKGSRYEQYTIVDKIGEGAHAKAYLASNRFRGGLSVIKILNFHALQYWNLEGLFRNFKFEFQIGQINSNHLIRSYDKGFIKGNPLIVSEYADGGDLHALIDENLSTSIINKIAVDVLQGLSALHQRDLVHRDLKPQNIFLAEQTFKIGDFGVTIPANRKGSDYEQLMTHNMVGTYGYMAPELFNTSSDTVIHPKNDIFSFGCLMFQVITGGALPFGNIKSESDIANYIYNSQNGIFRPLRSYRKDLPVYWEDLLYQCLQPDPAERQSSVEEMLDQLRSAASTDSEPTKKKEFRKKYAYDIYFSFAEADKLLAIEIFSFLDNKGLEIMMSKHLFESTTEEKEERPVYEQCRHFLALHTQAYKEEEQAHQLAKTFEEKRNARHQRMILYNAVIDEEVSVDYLKDLSIIQSKKEILNVIGIGDLFDRLHEGEQTIRLEAQKMKSEILDYIAQNKLRKAIGLFFKYLSETDPNNDATGSLSVLSSRYKSLEKDKMNGTISFEGMKIEENKLILGLNKLVLDFFK